MSDDRYNDPDQVPPQPGNEPDAPNGHYGAKPLPPLPWGEATEPPPVYQTLPVSPGYRVPAPLKPRTSVGFFVLGFVAALALEPLMVFLTGAVGVALQRLSFVLPLVSLAMLIGPLVVFLIAFNEGRRRMNDRLFSFGKGGLFGFFVPWVLLPLILFGTCFFSGFPN